MKKSTSFFTAISFLAVSTLCAQEAKKEPGHTENNKFRQMYQEFATPNMFRTASGAPGPAYYQQQADYKMNIELDDKNAKISGEEVITYYNNSKDNLEYLWVQLDQNQIGPTSKSPLVDKQKIDPAIRPNDFTKEYLKPTLERGFNIEFVKDSKGKALKYTINQTMMRIDLPKPLMGGEKMSFSIKWWYNINNHVLEGGRSGYEHFDKDGNNLYVIAQFYPRMAVYNDVQGWQNMQFWGSGEFALPFGNFDVNITVPADHIMEATGFLMNRKEVFTREQIRRYELAEKTYDKPIKIVTQMDAEIAEKTVSDKKKTWKFSAQNVRDFAFATSRKFIYDAMAVKLNDKSVMAISLYPKEGNPLWEEYSTRVVASTLKSYSSRTFDYPYHKAISVNSDRQGMEYPMICFNFGRPDEKGFVSERLKNGLISVVIHEVGHNWFPMIVNSDERQWTWMDEGLNTFMQYLAEQDYMPNYPSARGPAAKIVPYMNGDQNFLEPIMSNSENIAQFGSNAYAKPATGLNILRQTIMGPELFDYAFKTYANRWKFKHPTPEDFFRTMEDASAVDLDWFWRGWFYTTDYNDIGIKEVKRYVVANEPNKETKVLITKKEKAKKGKVTKVEEVKKEEAPKQPMVYMIAEDAKSGGKQDKSFKLKDIKTLSEYVQKKLSAEEIAKLKEPKYFYEVTFNKPGGLVMPILVEVTYDDNSTENFVFPAQIWRKNDLEVTRVFAVEKTIKKIVIDPKLETADVDLSNNTWPKGEVKSKFDKFERK
ncbi:M1 family metallopeptidase [Flavobacterium sp. '19STA2R22 D10 B1']|uniref:M1 family metallopeptidase n=1 Tax=Flavobacterium aerium TaxID=3037261 RepID=UPI00278BB222|nr:M1 family metallopeptidase [Flavobacterium sp. '19STA2R22 D10 B1']